MNVGLAQVFMLRVLVWKMRVCDRCMVVLVFVQRRHVLPFPHQLIRTLAPVMGHVWVLMSVGYRLM